MRRIYYCSNDGHERKFALVLAFAAALSAMIIFGLNPEKAYAVGGTVDGTTCEPVFGGTWNGANACTITTGFTIDEGETVTIPSGIALFVASNGFPDQEVGIDNRGTIIISGTLNVQNTGINGKGIDNSGSIVNTASGILVVQNSGHTGIDNEEFATISNSGILNVMNEGSNNLQGIVSMGNIENTASGFVTVANSAQFGIRLGSGFVNNATFTNHGTLTLANSAGTNGFQITQFTTLNNTATGTFIVENTGGTGVVSNGLIKNSGEVSVQNTAGIGIEHFGLSALENTPAGSIVVANSGDSTGIENNCLLCSGITNSGEMTIQSSGPSSIGIDNNEAINNTASGTLTLASTGGYGMFSGEDGAITNSGTLNIQNSGFFGIESYGTITNSGNITLANSGSIGLRNADVGSLSNSGNVTIQSTGSFGIENLGSIENAITGTVMVANIGSTGIDNFGTLSNFGDMSVKNTGTFGVRNLAPAGVIENDAAILIGPGADFSNTNIINNAASGTIINYGAFANGAGGTIDNDGSITTHSGGQINNAGTIDNVSGSIIVKCLGVYLGNPPVGNAVVIQPCPDTQITNAIDGKQKSIANGGKTTSTTIEFFFVGVDASGISKIECNLDGGGWQVCMSPKEYEGLQVGVTHVLQVRSYDSAGNVDPTPATFTWQISGPKK